MLIKIFLQQLVSDYMIETIRPTYLLNNYIKNVIHLRCPTISFVDVHLIFWDIIE